MEERLYTLAQQLRNALIQMDKSQEAFRNLTFFDKFPMGCCGITSEILAVLLYDNGIETECVNGWFKRRSHMWLEYGEFIIDITADQFDDMDEPVIITKNREYHKRFTGGERSEFWDFRNQKGRICSMRIKLYKAVLEYLSTV